MRTTESEFRARGVVKAGFLLKGLEEFALKGPKYQLHPSPTLIKLEAIASLLTAAFRTHTKVCQNQCLPAFLRYYKL